MRSSNGPSRRRVSVRATRQQPTAQPTRRGPSPRQGRPAAAQRPGQRAPVAPARERAGRRSPGSRWTESWRLPSGSSTSGGVASARGAPAPRRLGRQLGQRARRAAPRRGSRSAHHGVARRPRRRALLRAPKPTLSPSSSTVAPARQAAGHASTLPSLEPESTTTTCAAGRWRSTERSSAPQLGAPSRG